uniref:Ferredoxin-dependent glutamate synthase n=1 Tax=Taenioma perpusillum TaxID=210852 RepID=A0A1Z1MR73_9FLOR|nr:glutamate synthase [Taenioma perpusillum]ARW68456.1 glutamate synthase [Taenioma perpusillum]
MQASKYLTYKLSYFLGYPSISNERDACGVGFVAQINEEKSNLVISNGLRALSCMEHRGGCGADEKSGDGSGIMTQIPWDLFIDDIPNLASQNINISQCGVAMIFIPNNHIQQIKDIFEWVLKSYELNLVSWRKVPVDSSSLGLQSMSNEPLVMQCFVEAKESNNLENLFYIVRKKVEKVLRDTDFNIYKNFYVCSFSSRIIVYKAMVTSEILSLYYKDLSNPLYYSNFALYHRRFSTNTMPKWSLAQPMRLIAHNGEINTLLGNLNWMRSKESLLIHQSLQNFHDVLVPIVNPDNSDSANLDSVVELLVRSGKSPEEALMILIPEAYKNQPSLSNSSNIIDFYEYYSHLQEPWDGPALVTFSDGNTVGATLDRNGLRPARYLITSDGLITLSSEAGLFNIDDSKIIKKGRLGPGQMFCVDLNNNVIFDNLAIKTKISQQFPYKKWLNVYRHEFSSQSYLNTEKNDVINLMRLHTVFGYTNEDVELVIEHMASSSKEPTFCMGDDIPLPILSHKPHLLYDYFKQRFAQVTNPAIDPLRESLVMSLDVYIGPKGNFLQPNDILAKSIKLKSPILNENELVHLCNSSFKVSKLDTFIEINDSNNDFGVPIENICLQCLKDIENGVELIVLSDRPKSLDQKYIFIPPLLMIGSLHHYLIKKNLRHKVSIIVETGQCWSTHHFACLIGYGASAICPYLAFRTVRQWWNQPRTQKFISIGRLPNLSIEKSQDNYRVAIEKGLLKILSKMGICLLSSYHGAQIFEILGLSKDVVDIAFAGTTSRISGMNMKELFNQSLFIHKSAFANELPKKLPNLGYVQYRPGAEYHVNNPEMSKTLHKAVRNNDGLMYDNYQKLLASRDPVNLRDMLFVSSNRDSIDIANVESLESIMSTFCTGGMSLGALSRETHETLAIAMNRIGGKSNSGEGGEDSIRFKLIKDVDDNNKSNTYTHLKGLRNDDIANSAIKQIASGRFGVTPEYLVNADQLEIKIAQGAKPGEGGQLPGKKVSEYIASLRNCKPGVTLISPPPHHDIYSIEDLAQLIFDLHQINDQAQVSVKLVSSVGIGTIAAGVAKGNADVIQVSGHDGGTGASPLSSIKHAGIPWELGLTDVHKTLLENDLRSRVILRVDGGLRTGQDVVLAALMGAQEFGFGTIAMIATGCVMARICHTNNCPVGVATQRQDLRNRYPGVPGDLVNFFIFVAEEVRNILAHLGYSSLQEIIGETHLLKLKPYNLSKTSSLNLDILMNFENKKKAFISHKSVHKNNYSLDDILLNNSEIINAIKSQADLTQTFIIKNTDRCVGAKLSGFIIKKYGQNNFKGNLQIHFEGTAGQSFGAFISTGIYLSLIGEANDYVGKGINGGEIIVSPAGIDKKDASNNVIIGNTCLYGATGGYLFAHGQAGERFAVRNSCAQAVVEGVGDHACEYMTGGLIIVLGYAGRNIAAGMTGGLAYFLDESNTLFPKINKEIVRVQKVITREAEDQLKNMIELYEIKTKSVKARHILDNWSSYINLFIQIVPPSEEDTVYTSVQHSSYAELIK